ncbi:hypothetical protein DFH06DRAFT_100206 [Mycena polygramma]|nr:hypothetical protein DFH06DRAFT_100206 [Mycena polygramma]
MAKPCWKCGAPPRTTLAAIDVQQAPPGESSQDLARLMTTNEAPLDSEVQSIQILIAHGKQQADALDAQIADFHATLTQLVRKRDETMDGVRQYRALLSSVRRVPLELLCEIFALTMSADDAAERPPWYLGHICRSWRFSALACPSLWTSIILPNSTHSMLPMIQTQLLRSANAPLTVHWSTDTDESAPMDPHSREVVIANCSRWGTLRLDVQGSPSTTDLEWLRPVAGRLTALRKFDVNSLPGLKIPEIFWEASSLREVSVDGSRFEFYSPPIVAPWAQITRFRGVYDTETQRIILAAASNLTQCAISFQGDSGPLPPITTPCLQHLCINTANRLVNLTAPLLKELFIVYHSALVELPHFVHRSSCRLKTLALMRCTISSDLITVLRELPTLTSLLIEDEHSTKNDVAYLLEAMTITGTSGDTSPNLTSIVFGAGLHFPCNIFFAMAQSRFKASPPSPPLKRLGLFSFSGDWTEVLVPIQKLRNEGFDANILSESETRLVKTQGFVWGNTLSE